MNVAIHTYTTGKTATGLQFPCKTETLLDMMEQKGWEVRRWKSTDGNACGVARPFGTLTFRAVGMFSETQPGYAVIYRCMQPADAHDKACEDAYDAGYTACRRGFSNVDNPYVNDDGLAEAWNDGWFQCADDREEAKYG